MDELRGRRLRRPIFGGLAMSLRRKLKPWCWCVPAVLLILIIIVFPIIYTGYISLTNMNLYHWQDYEVIGLDNYARAPFQV